MKLEYPQYAYHNNIELLVLQPVTLEAKGRGNYSPNLCPNKKEN
jgi:hypothetical protein